MKIGVTGHRRLGQPAAVAEAVSGVMADLKRESGGRHVIMLSALAEGVDRIAAVAALAMDDASLQVVLPLEATDYVGDFEHDDSRAEFHGLMDRAAEIVQLEPRSARGEAYEAAGHHVVDHCDVLIAVWDGRSARGRGGTADIVAYAHRQGRPVYWIDSRQPDRRKILEDSDLGGDEIMSREPVQISADSGDGEADAVQMADLGPWGELFRTSVEHCAEPPEPGVIDELAERYRKVVEHFQPAQDDAEMRAETWQNTYRRASTTIFVLAAAAILIVALQSIFHLDHWVIALEVIAIATILLLFYRGSRREWHYNWIESRLEAEWLRHGIFVAFLSGETVPGIDRHWACRWVSAANGVSAVRRKWERMPTLAPLREEGLVLLKEFMARAWLQDQIDYHREKSILEKARHKRITTAGEVMFWATFVVAIVHLLPHQAYHALHLPDKPIVGTLTLLAIGLPTIGAALAGLRSHFEFRKIASRSAMMADHLAELKRDLERVGSVTELKAAVREAETLMLQENSDWYFTIGMHHLEKG